MSATTWIGPWLRRGREYLERVHAEDPGEVWNVRTNAPKGVPIALPDCSNRRAMKIVVQSAIGSSGD